MIVPHKKYNSPDSTWITSDPVLRHKSIQIINLFLREGGVVVQMICRGSDHDTEEIQIHIPWDEFDQGQINVRRDL